MKVSLKKIIFLSVLSLSLAACSKEPKKVLDPGPQFGVVPGSVSFTGLSDTLELVRGDSEGGPEIQIEPSSEVKDIKFIGKSLICGPLTVAASQSEGSDLSLFRFRINESEFPGLKDLPIQPTCQLSVVLTNAIGSTVSQQIPVHLKFDSLPAVGVTAITIQIGMSKPSANKEILLESYSVQNPFSYPIGVRFFPHRIGFGLPTYNLTHYALNGGQPVPSQLHTPLSFSPTRIEVAGPLHDRHGGGSLAISGTIFPNDTVTFSSFYRFPENFNMPRTYNPCPYAGYISCSGPFAGILTLQAGPDDGQSSSLSLWKDFTESEEDDNSPAFLNRPEMAPVRSPLADGTFSNTP